MDANSSICLSRIANGQLEEKFQHELARVMQNLMDINTPYRDKRKITIDMTFGQDEERREIQISLAVKSKLAPRAPVRTHFGTGRDLKTGKLYIEEYGSQLRGQTQLKEKEQEVEVLGVRNGGYEEWKD